MDTLLQDLRYALRTLGRQWLFTVTAVLTLALGIGANTATFSLVDAVLLRPLPYAAPEQLVVVWGEHPNVHRETASLPDFNDWRAGGSAFSELAALAFTSLNLSGDGEPERVPAVRATSNFFTLFGVAPVLGRGFLPEEERQGAAPVVVLGHGLWQRRFGGRADVLGRTVTVDGLPTTVVGVAAPGFHVLADAEAWVPLTTDNPGAHRRSDYLNVIGRLKPGVTLGAAQAQLNTVTARLAEQYPETNANWRVELVSLHEELVGDSRTALLVFMGAVGLVLLIACANVANLLLARSAAREREMAVRSALGAGRARLLRQLLTESAVLSLVGGGLGVLLALWGVDALRAARPGLLGDLPVSLNGRVLGFTVGLSLLTGMLFGLAPALRLAGRSPRESLHRGAAGVSAGMGTVRRALVLAEVALALVLLVGAGLLLRSFDRLQRVDPGFNSDGVLTARVVLPRAKYGEDARQLGFYDALVEELSRQPGVRSAAAVSFLPLASADVVAFEIEGRPRLDPGELRDAQFYIATPGWFRVAGIALKGGRLFGAEDSAGAPRVAVVNETLAKRFWPGQDPVGARVSVETGVWATVVGVVGDTRSRLRAEPQPQLYVPLAQLPRRGMYLTVRTEGEPLALVPALRGALARQDASLALSDVRTLEEHAGLAARAPRLQVLLMGLAAGVALALAALGIYGVVAFSVSQRTRELGIRMALGARAGDVLGLVLRQGMAPVLGGIAVGLVGAWVLTRWMGSLLYEVSAVDAPTYVGVPLFLAVVALVATWLPARRATRVQPSEALRQE